MKKRIPEFQISLVKFLDGKDDTLFTHSSLSFQEWAGIERRGRGNSKVSKLVSKWMPRVIHTHTYIYISSSSSSLNRLLRKRSVPANCNSDSADRNSRLPEILQASSEGIPGAKLSSCRSNEEISSESRIRTSIFEDFSASCFPNSRCAKIQDPASFWIGRESFLWIWLTTGWLEQG